MRERIREIFKPPLEVVERPVILQKDMVGPALEIVERLHGFGNRLSIESITAENDTFGIYEKFASNPDYFPFLLKGSSRAVNAFIKCESEAERWYGRYRKHSTLTKAAFVTGFAAIVTVVVLKHIKDSHYPSRFSGEDFEQ